MNFSEIGLKDLVLDFDSNDLQDITIVQGDTKTRGFKVLVSTNNGEIIKASSNYEMRLYGVNSNYPDKSFFTKGVIDGDFYKVYISTDMASKSGKLQLQLALFEGTNALIQSRIKEVDVYRSISNGGNVGKDLVVDFGKLNNALEIAEKQQKKFDESLIRQESIESDLNKTKTEVRQFRDGLKDVLTTENARVEAENKRVSAEDVRASQESTRQSNENTRQSNETARQQNESTRTSQETQRQAEESTRKSDEQKRITAESGRNSEETKRDNAEKIRIENENKRVSAENTRSENDVAYNKNEQQRQSQESTRQSQEQQRVDAEKQRISQETTRKQSEDTRNSQESTRQSQEQSRVDAESKRAASEITREQSEQTRNTKETERQNAEQTRQVNEKTRISQETSRIEAEKQRVDAEAGRAGKFAAWDKTMQGVIPTATSTVAGIVRIDEDGETVAISEKTYLEGTGRLMTLHEEFTNSMIEKLHLSNTNFNEQLNLKADKKTVDESVNGLTERFNEFDTVVGQQLELKADKKDVDSNIKNLEQLFNNATGGMYSMVDEVRSKITTNTTEIDNTKKIANANSKSISDISTTLDNKASKADLNNKADKKHTHAINDVDGLKNTLDNHERIFNSNIGSISNLADKLQFKASTDSVAELKKKVDEKANKTHKHSIADITNLQTKLDEKANDKALSKLARDMLYKINSDIVKNIFIIENGASTSNIPANSLIFEKE